MPCSGPNTDHVENDAQQALEDIMVYLEETYHVPKKEQRKHSMFDEMFVEAEGDLKKALVKMLTADAYDGF
jgi:methenyltetrahydromethanopterin cyclohydrolase